MERTGKGPQQGKALKCFVVITAMLFLQACSLDAKLSQLSKEIKDVVSQKMRSDEIVPSSQQGVVTADGYQVQSSLSYHASKAEVVTADGYRVQTSVQSSLYKEVK